MSKKKSPDELESVEDESVKSSGNPDRDPLTVVQSLRERLSRWQHFSNHDKIEADKEIDFLESQFS